MADDGWMQAAECRGAGAQMIIPYTQRKTVIRKATAVAVAICDTCPVRTPCADWACAGDVDPVPHHIAGGLTPTQREQQRRARTGVSLAHGTAGGYNRHYRQGEPPCDPCVTAHREYKRARYRQRATA